MASLPSGTSKNQIFAPSSNLIANTCCESLYESGIYSVCLECNGLLIIKKFKMFAPNYYIIILVSCVLIQRKWVDMNLV